MQAAGNAHTASCNLSTPAQDDEFHAEHSEDHQWHMNMEQVAHSHRPQPRPRAVRAQ